MEKTQTHRHEAVVLVLNFPFLKPASQKLVRRAASLRWQFQKNNEASRHVFILEWLNFTF